MPSPMAQGMKLFALTGGIASGKSTVARMFEAQGVPVIDADLLARELVEPGRPALVAIGRRWPDCLDDLGRLDRARLGSRVFQRPEERAELEAILHPAIQAEAIRRALALAEAGHPLALYEAALIFEKHLEPGFAGVVLVATSPATQLARLCHRDGLDEARALERMRAQLPLEEKRRRAQWVVNTEGPLEETRAQVEAVFRSLVEAAR